MGEEKKEIGSCRVDEAVLEQLTYFECVGFVGIFSFSL